MVGLVLLSAAIAAGWVRSYLVADLAQYFRTTTVNATTDEQESYQFSSGNGGLSLAWGTTEFAFSTAQEEAENRRQSGYTYDGRFRLNWTNGDKWYGGSGYTPASMPHFLGFSFYAVSAKPCNGFAMTMPWALPLLLVGAYPGWRGLKAWRGRRRFAEGHCVKCGYDLRASSERCPECGTAIGASDARPAE